MKNRVCFIDDDADFEIPLFKEVFESEFEIISATNMTDLKVEIDSRKDWIPDLFILDMYFPESPPDYMAIENLKNSHTNFNPDNADIRIAFTNFLAASKRLKDVLAAWKQDADGGISFAKQVAETFPEIPIVFYSRKASLKDAIRCLSLKNVYNVILKPTGKSDEHTRALTFEESSRLVTELRNAMNLPGAAKLAQIKRSLPFLVRLLKDFFDRGK